MKKLLYFLVFLLNISLQAQSQVYNWGHGIGSSGPDNCTSVTHDALGNVYSTGSFQGTVDFDPGSGVYNLSSATGDNMYVLKLNAAGNLVWAKRIGPTGSTAGSAYGNSIKLDNAGNVVVAGYFNGTVDFDPGAPLITIGSAGSEDAFILQLDSAGGYLWTHHIGGSSQDFAVGLAIDTSNNILCIGSFAGRCEFNIGGTGYRYTSFGNQDIFVAKLLPSGNLRWVKQMGGRLTDIGYGICTDDSNNVYSTGLFADTADFDPWGGVFNLVAPSTGTDAYISKLTTNGNFIWAKQIGDSAHDVGYGIVVDSAHHVYTTGCFTGTVDFDPGAGTYNLSSAGGSTDMFISHLDLNGDFVWARGIGGSAGYEAGSGIAMDTTHHLYVTGVFQGTVDFDPDTGVRNLVAASSTGYDIYLYKCDSSGTYDTAISWGGRGSDVGNTISVSKSGDEIYIGGGIVDTVDLDAGARISLHICGGSGTDIFIEKLSMCIPGSAIVSISARPGTTIFAGQSDTFSATLSGGTAIRYHWLLNSAPIAGATLSSFVTSILSEGDVICCVVTYFDSCASSTTIVTGCVTIHIANAVDSLQSAVGSLLVFPNPNGGEFVVELSGVTGNKDAVVRVLDILGREVYKGTLPASGVGKIQLGSGIPGGVYLLQLWSEGILVSGRILLER